MQIRRPRHHDLFTACQYPRMKNRSLAALAGLLLLVACQTTPPPNVVMIIGDDQSWGDYGFMGHPVIETPRLDQLAAESAVFGRGYVPSSLCRPSLATMITGLYPHQHLITGNDPPKRNERQEMLKHIAAVDTLPRWLATRGYRSLQTGKWWEGNCRCGGFTDGMTHGDQKRGGRHGDKGLEIGRKTMQPIYDFVADCGEQPFFLWYAPFLPHKPHNPPERLLKKYRAEGRSIHVARYFAMCEWFDETCGQLLDHLEERGLSDNTIVLFASDNGWIQREDRGSYAPRSKRSPNEGGVRTPIMIRWPGKVTPGRRNQLASTIDFAPTILDAAGISSERALPGVDLVSLAGDEEAPRNTIFGEIFAHDVADVDEPGKSLQHRWIIDGTWKLIVPAKEGARPELYDLGNDPEERQDLATREPDRVRTLLARLDRWWQPR